MKSNDIKSPLNKVHKFLPISLIFVRSLLSLVKCCTEYSGRITTMVLKCFCNILFTVRLQRVLVFTFVRLFVSSFNLCKKIFFLLFNTGLPQIRFLC